MFQLDDKFLDSVGLGSLPDDQKQLFIDHFREQLELRIGTKLSEGLSDGQLSEFEAFIDRNNDVVNFWIARNVPEYQNDSVYQQLKTGAPEGVTEEVVLAEYASLKWLGLNRPDYKQVVSSTIEELKHEIMDNRQAILGGDGPSLETNS